MQRDDFVGKVADDARLTQLRLTWINIPHSNRRLMLIDTASAVVAGYSIRDVAPDRSGRVSMLSDDMDR
jgi:hypothetical protein